MRMVVWRALLLLALLAVAALAIPVAAEEKNVIVIGLTKSSGKYERESTEQLRGILLWAKWVNETGGIKVGDKTYYVRIVYYDDQSKKDLVQQLYEKLITQDKVDFLFSPYSSGLSMAAVPIAEKYGVPIVVVGAASDKIFTDLKPKCAFQIYTPASKYLTSSLDLVKKYMPNAKVYILYEDTTFAATVAEAAKAYAEKIGLEVVGYESYPRDVKDFTAALERVRASGATVLIGGGHYRDGLLLAKQIRELGLDEQLKFVSLLVAVDLPSFYKDMGEAANGFAGPSQWEPKVKYTPELAKKLGIKWIGPTVDEFVKMYREAYGTDPGYHAAGGFAAGLFLQAAIEAAGSIDRMAVCNAAKKLDILTFFGRLAVDPETGLQVAHEMVVVQWQNGAKEVIWPESAATAKPITLKGEPLAPAKEQVKEQTTSVATETPATRAKTTPSTTTAEAATGTDMTIIIIGVIVAIIVLGFLAWYIRARE
ncbi:Extracellular ligand-binding receptor [Pyrolobus fumarii 1A]|uniref:Extracellular ligand-binding receptor n=1 Tax=Pyrolobus fumarii (strain DSM 11204 / 1A) TaxID=694429 RepID=G0EF35_PYRF1|nr:amino acid ABC transporter substrate-binding protein [Pyrolobus fumarii]AEM38932.1 Extracellular ligand-binding receptor [Pyrolobus fumarii 1A]